MIALVIPTENDQAVQCFAGLHAPLSPSRMEKIKAKIVDPEPVNHRTDVSFAACVARMMKALKL